MAAVVKFSRVKASHLGQLKRTLNCIWCHKTISKGSMPCGITLQSTRRTMSSFGPQLVPSESLVSYLPKTRGAASRWCSSSSSSQGPGESVALADSEDPYELVKTDFADFFADIHKALRTDQSLLQDLATYHFDGQGKAFRPTVVLLMARACNHHTRSTDDSSVELLRSQRHVAMISEMIHTASLVHDDVVDTSETRRGKPSAQAAWGQRKAILAGNYILSISSLMLARIRNEEVVEVLSQVLEDLVRGEFMQLGSRENENERFAHYLKKTFKKTASLIANACKAVSILSGCSEEMVEVSFQYGRNIGIAFQLVDDLLDFVSNETLMGKPTAADLKLGLATAPVLFAAQQYPELNSLIMRRFNKPGDVERAMKFVEKSDGIRQTKFLAEKHCEQAVRVLQRLRPSRERDGLELLTRKVLNRLK